MSGSGSASAAYEAPTSSMPFIVQLTSHCTVQRVLVLIFFKITHVDAIVSPYY
jgi:hypothetical protein